MKAVFLNENLVYLGNEESVLIEWQDIDNGVPRFGGVRIVDVYCLEDLAVWYQNSDPAEKEPCCSDQESCTHEAPSDPLNEVLIKLDQLDLEELTDKLVDQTEQVVAEVKSLGIKGMEAVGRGFIALGELLHKAGTPDDK